MVHNQLLPLLEAVCYAFDYGKDSHTKALELKDKLIPLSSQVDRTNGLEALYGIIAISLKLTEELECINVNVEESSSQKVDLLDTAMDVKQS